MRATLDTSTPALREFAYTMAVAFVVIFCLLLPWLLNHKIPYWPLILAGLLLLQAWIYPNSLIPVQYGWMRIGAALGWINTRIILAVVFFLLIAPIGWIQRKRGKLNYHTGFDATAESYKIPRSQHLKAEDLENPF